MSFAYSEMSPIIVAVYWNIHLYYTALLTPPITTACVVQWKSVGFQTCGSPVRIMTTATYTYFIFVRFLEYLHTFIYIFAKLMQEKKISEAFDDGVASFRMLRNSTTKINPFRFSDFPRVNPLFRLSRNSTNNIFWSFLMITKIYTLVVCEFQRRMTFSKSENHY